MGESGNAACFSDPANNLGQSLQFCNARLAWHCRTARFVLNCLLGQKSRQHCMSQWGSGCCQLTKLISFSSLLQEVQVDAVVCSSVFFWRINYNPLIWPIKLKKTVWQRLPAADRGSVA